MLANATWNDGGDAGGDKWNDGGDGFGTGATDAMAVVPADDNANGDTCRK